MPIKKVKGGFKYGNRGKVYKTRAGAEKQAAAIHASGYKEEKEPKSMRQAVEGGIKDAR
jgi:tRNA splicing endonuclease